jgi:hypothetical protein
LCIAVCTVYFLCPCVLITVTCCTIQASRRYRGVVVQRRLSAWFLLQVLNTFLCTCTPSLKSSFWIAYGKFAVQDNPGFQTNIPCLLCVDSPIGVCDLLRCEHLQRQEERKGSELGWTVQEPPHDQPISTNSRHQVKTYKSILGSMGRPKGRG